MASSTFTALKSLDSREIIKRQKPTNWNRALDCAKQAGCKCGPICGGSFGGSFACLAGKFGTFGTWVTSLFSCITSPCAQCCLQTTSGAVVGGTLAVPACYLGTLCVCGCGFCGDKCYYFPCVQMRHEDASYRANLIPDEKTIEPLLYKNEKIIYSALTSEIDPDLNSTLKNKTDRPCDLPIFDFPLNEDEVSTNPVPYSILVKKIQKKVLTTTEASYFKKPVIPTESENNTSPLTLAITLL